MRLNIIYNALTITPENVIQFRNLRTTVSILLKKVLKGFMVNYVENTKKINT